ncbi:YciI family protein [Isoptericola sp. NPDC019693]|uniref:YciI family protein n=1 Tax=Isoptericola sp. NPDC019693 TaxID=3364009 RepID=UPI0037A70CD5
MRFDELVLVRLVRPDDWAPLPEDDVLAVQDAHLAAVADLRDRGLLLAAGPAAGGDERVRGFAVMTCRVEEAQELWAQDPGVLAGRFVAECTAWLTPAGTVVAGPGVLPRSVAEAQE